jgi:hypothetical protein
LEKEQVQPQVLHQSSEANDSANTYGYQWDPSQANGLGDHPINQLAADSCDGKEIQVEIEENLGREYWSKGWSSWF